MNKISSLVFIVFLLSTQSMSATEPLHDTLSYQGQTGNIFPEKCCWLKKPESKELRALEIKIMEQGRCSAIGGPVSQLKLEDKKLFLTGLYKCGGDIPLSDVYPAFTKPALAVWLSGTFHSNLKYLCHNKKGRMVFETEMTLVVEKGLVIKNTKKINDKSSCTDGS